MKKKVQEVLAANNSASHVLLHDGMYAAFGAASCQDFVRIGSAKGCGGYSLYEAGARSSAEETYCADLFRKVFALSDPALLGSFRIAPWQLDFIRRAIKSINATHFTLFGDQDGVFFNCFDALRFIPEARMNRRHETRVLTHQLKEMGFSPFYITLNAASVMRLPRAALDVGIGNNKVAMFTDDGAGDTYLLRDLEVSAPIVNFFSDRLQTSISLSLPANSLLQDPGTSQPDSLEWEYDEQDLLHPPDP
jgi:hypothetical protein